jgi:hypothetical protein
VVLVDRETAAVGADAAGGQRAHVVDAVWAAPVRAGEDWARGQDLHPFRRRIPRRQSDACVEHDLLAGACGVKADGRMMTADTSRADEGAPPGARGSAVGNGANAGGHARRQWPSPIPYFAPNTFGVG